MIGPRTMLALVVAGAAGCLLIVYLSSTGRLPPDVAVGVALVPVFTAAIALAWRTRLRAPVALAVMAAIAASVLYRDALSRHVATLWLLQHVGVHGLLAYIFGRTLRAGEEPLVTRIARAVLPSMPPEVVRYARKVTVAWTIYFAAMCVISLVVYFSAGAVAWSTFATFVSGPMVALMFVLEFAVRCRVVPASHRGTIALSVSGFQALVRARGARSLEAPSSHG